MEAAKFIKLLGKRKWLIIGVPLVTLVLSFFLIRNLPDSYESHARMSTGLVDQSQQVITKEGFQENKINIEFSNLLEMMRLEKVFDQVSYRLIIHDLTDSVAFRKKSNLLKKLNSSAIDHAIEVYRKHYTERTPLNPYNEDEKELIKLISSMDYGYDQIKKNLLIYRPNNSDFIDVIYTSDNPYLSAYLVNATTEEFIAYYSDFMKNNNQRKVSFLDTLLSKKGSQLARLKGELETYKVKNRILNTSEEASNLFKQLSNYQTTKQSAEKDIASYEGALKNIDDKFNPKDRKYFEASIVPINQQISATKQFLLNMSDEYIKSNYDEKIKHKIDSAKNVANSQIQIASDKYISNPQSSKESLVQQKAKMELDLDLAKFSLSTLTNEIDRLNKQYDVLVPHEAAIQNYESAIEIASKEYLDAQNRFNQSSLESSLAISLKQIEVGVPLQPTSSKKMLLVAVSFIVSLILVIVVLFIVFYFDDSIATSTELANNTNKVVLGSIPLLGNSLIQLKALWGESFTENTSMLSFREMLRSCRFEIENEMGKSKILLINSLTVREGKSFFAMSLAYAFLMIKKRVLLIDGNFSNPVITKETETEFFIEDFLSGKKLLNADRSKHEIVVLGNKGGDTSLLEISNSENIEMKLNQLKEDFDIIIIESEGLTSFNKSKEWILFSEKVLTIFESRRKISIQSKQSIEYLKGLNEKFIGWIFNKDENKSITKY
ncbi:MAG: lipopolysaccharide biosynthesis protein [Bacteroidota bacterium]